MAGAPSFACSLLLWLVLRLSSALSCYGWRSVFRQIPRYDHRQAEFCPKLCLSPLFLRLEPPFWVPTGNFDPETLPVSPVFVPSTLISGTDRRRISPNSACLRCFCVLRPRFGHRQATLAPKLCLSLPFSCLRPSFWAPTGAESAQTLPVGPEFVCWGGVILNISWHRPAFAGVPIFKMVLVI